MEKFPGTADAGLDLVQDEQQAVLSGQRPQFAQKSVGRGPDAGFTLDRLQHHANGFVIYQSLHRRQIVQLRLGKA